MDRVDNEYRLYEMGDLNGWVRDRLRKDITSALEVSGKINNEGRVVDLCAEREDVCVIDTSSTRVFALVV